MLIMITIQLFVIGASLTASVATGSGLAFAIAFFGLVGFMWNFNNLLDSTIEAPEEPLAIEPSSYLAVNIPAISPEWVDPFTVQFWAAQYEETQTKLEASSTLPATMPTTLCNACGLYLPPTFKHACYAQPKVILAPEDRNNITQILRLRNKVLRN